MHPTQISFQATPERGEILRVFKIVGLCSPQEVLFDRLCIFKGL